MSSYINLIIQAILILVLTIVMFLLLRLSKSVKKEKRIAKFSIDALTDRPVSFFDRLEDSYKNKINKLSKTLKKSAILKNYSKHYEKYVDQTKKNREDAMDLISNKIIISILAVIITLISDVLRVKMISITQLLFALVIGFFLPDIFLIIEEKRRKKKIEEDILKAVIIMNNAFKSGRSIMQAVLLVSNELDGVVADEFKKIYIDLTYGLDLEIVFKRFSDRMNLEDVKYMASSLIILNKTGGNVAKVFSSIEKGFFDRRHLRDELKATLALSDMMYKILVAMPLILFIIIYMFNPNYFLPLVTTVLGKILLVLILGIYLIYIIIVRKVTKVKELGM